MIAKQRPAVQFVRWWRWTILWANAALLNFFKKSNAGNKVQLIALEHTKRSDKTFGAMATWLSGFAEPESEYWRYDYVTQRLILNTVQQLHLTVQNNVQFLTFCPSRQM